MNWKVYSKADLDKLRHDKKPDTNMVAPLGDFLQLDTVAGNKSVAYVNEDGEISWIPVQQAVLMPVQTDLRHLGSSPSPRARS